MNHRQRLFADAYIETGNATEAARRAGYSPRTANRIGSENLARPDISAYISARLEALAAERVASADEVMRLLTAIMRGEVVERIPLFTGNGAQTLVETTPRISDRLKASAEIMKRYNATAYINEYDVPIIIARRPDSIPLEKGGNA